MSVKMRKVATAIILFMSALFAFADTNALFSFSGQSYIQRGVLTFDNREIALNVYVVCSNGKSKMIMDTQAGRLARIELDEFGNVIICEGGKLFPTRFVERLLLPNFRAIMGFTKFLNQPLVYLKNGKVCEIQYDDCVIKFCETSVKSEKIELPRVEIESKSYKVELNYISKISKK